MIVIYDPDPASEDRCFPDSAVLADGGYKFERWASEGEEPKKGESERIEAVGYLLYHGGETVRESVSAIGRATLKTLERCIPYFPQFNELTFNAIQYGTARYFGVPQFLFCDTSYFLDLPPEASTYAVPTELRESGIRRYGGYGLFHEYALECVKHSSATPSNRIISVCLGNHTNVAAIKDGKPLETSVGFTLVEGIVSSTGCGDLDPTIVFQLMHGGMTLREINRSLTQEAGFTGLAGRPCTFRDVAGDTDEPSLRGVREKLLYDVKRYVGAGIETLGGIDVLVLQCEDVEGAAGLIREICTSLEFIGLRTDASPRRQGDLIVVTQPSSRIQAVCIRSHRADIIGHRIQTIMNKENEL